MGTDCKTIRERILRATDYFGGRREGVVLTTFNLNSEFLEEQALPIVFGIIGRDDAVRSAAVRRTELHNALAETPCSVYYDPGTIPRMTGKYRYFACPVPLRGRFFHPKLVIIGGRASDGTSWVYLAVSSANLTLSGWGRNAESFGETWIHTRKQESWQGLVELLGWLKERMPFGEAATNFDAVDRVLNVLKRMKSRRRFYDAGTEPWSGRLHAKFYTSVGNQGGLVEFLRMGRARRPAELWAFSPYWGDVGNLVKAFGAWRTVLVPARTRDGGGLGLSRSQGDQAKAIGNVEIRKNVMEDGSRFWHMKAFRMQHGKYWCTAVGSCNFSSAGLKGGGGNVEAMLVYWSGEEVLPDCRRAEPEELAEVPTLEEDQPTPAPVAIFVAYDWLAGNWRWYLDPAPGLREYWLTVPGVEGFEIEAGKKDGREGKAPERGANFTLAYRTDRGDKKEWRGPITELNLDSSTRRYGGRIRPDDILNSWMGRSASLAVDLAGEDGDEDAGNEEGNPGAVPTGDAGSDSEVQDPGAFDALNLYDFYRSIRSLWQKLIRLENDPPAVRAAIVGRPDSVMTLAGFADHDEVNPAVRYLVLGELFEIVKQWAQKLSAQGAEYDLQSQFERVSQMLEEARVRLRSDLEDELQGELVGQADKVLDWFDQKLMINQELRIDQQTTNSNEANS